jgi:ribosome-binding protein aMBF1 (putative translation factor)
VKSQSKNNPDDQGRQHAGSYSYAERVKAARKKAGLSQAALGRKWGFPNATIHAWENGIRHPHGLYREKLEKILVGMDVFPCESPINIIEQ